MQGGIREWISAGLVFIPVVGNIKAGVEAIFGVDFITGRKLEPWERAISAASVVVGGAGKLAKYGANLLEDGGKLVGKLADGMNVSRTQLATVGVGAGGGAGNWASNLFTAGKDKLQTMFAKKDSSGGSSASKNSSKGTGKNTENLYKRGKFRKRARSEAESEAPRYVSGKMICPTCGRVIHETININTKNGTVTRIGYDLDHYPDTWAGRVAKMKAREVHLQERRC